MPQTRVVFYAEANVAPFLLWLDELGETVQNKMIARVELLAARGHDLRRPHADTLRDGIHELRIVSQHVNYRALYFFHGQTAVISHGITKTDVVPPREIDRAIEHKRRFSADPAKHTYTES
ncbi:MAG TPA: type II toxin-antitoxin system RelE/ParE family toxin [Longimicrobiaceae bacterium]|nr:type II toxin-antitoxin system RelE/ParE family toxin [Longimicrobiaceae bacterium]